MVLSPRTGWFAEPGSTVFSISRRQRGREGRALIILLSNEYRNPGVRGSKASINVKGPL